MQTAPDFLSLYASALREHAQGRHERAVEFYRAALAVIPNHAEANANLGTALLSLERAEEAIAAYRAALEADPFLNSAHGPLGMALSATGRHAEACAHLEIALDAAPKDADLNFYLAESRFVLGRHADAAVSYEAAFEANPDHAAAALGAGRSLLRLGETQRALDLLREAYRLRPDVDAGFNLACALLEAECFEDAAPLLRDLAARSDEIAIANNLALALHKTGDVVGAVATLHAALRRRPENANAWNTLGSIFTGLDRPRIARAAFARAGESFEPPDHDGVADNPRVVLNDIAALRARIDADPDDAEAWRELGAAVMRADVLQVARYALDKAVALAPDEPEGWVNLAHLHLRAHDKPKALACARRALAICPPEPSRLLAVANQIEALQGIDSAIMLYRRVLEIDPANRKAASRILHLTLANCDWSDYDGLVARTLQRVRDDVAAGRQLAYVIFNLLALPVTHAFVDEVARHQSARLAADIRAQAPQAAPFAHAPRNDKRIRIGYLLPYTFFHSMPLVLKEIVQRHDRERFEVFGYSITRSDGTTFCDEFRSVFDRFSDVSGANAHAAARLIHEDGIDILVDTTGQTPISCLPIMSLRPAPVQAHAIGFGLSTGADYIDYLISDRTFMPPEAQQWCAERLVYMPDCFLPAFLRAAEDGDDSRAEHGLPEDGVVFMNFNEAVKFEPCMFGAWMNILRAVPGGVLWLGTWHRPVRENLRREAEARGVAGERLVFAKIVPHAKHARRIRLADMALDNLHHGGGVTSIDALSAGVPLLTLRGATPQSRLGATLSQAAGFPDLIVDSLQDYERTAIELARDPARRSQLRAKLEAGRDEAPLFDIDRYRRCLERAYQTMHGRRRAGLPPAAFDVSPA
jgi:predicted O-linked N-acetylglucosamine transferase (SPINDLY family)